MWITRAWRIDREMQVSDQRAGVDGGRPAAAGPAHRGGVVLHLPGRRPARGRRRPRSRSASPSNHVRDRILTRYLPLVTDALDEVDRAGVRRSRSSSTSATPTSRARPTSTTTVADATARRHGAGDAGRARRPGRYGRRALLDEAGLNPRYTFETFVKGASNQFALAAALRVAETPGRSLQPAVHLRLGRPRQDPPAARHRPLRAPQLPAPRWSATSRTETFLNEYVDAIRTNTDSRLQAPLPRHRRAADRRHPVHGGQGGPAGGVLPHVQLAARRQQADRDLLRPHARRHPDARGAPARPVQVGPDHRHPAARPRDPPGHPAQQGRARPRPGAGRDARVHRHQDHHQHP